MLVQSGGSLSLPRPTSTSPGSQVRTWSQSSQGRRHEPLGCRASNMHSFHRMPERDSRSPRPHTSSHTHLSAAAGGLHTNGISKQHMLQPEQLDESPKMNNLRQSLLQHIQSVQQEIARLQMERQRTQQISASELPDLPQAKKLLQPTSVSRTGVPLQPPDLPLAPEEAATTPLLDPSQTARWNRPVQWPLPGGTLPRSVPVQPAILAPSTPASATVPMLGSGSLLLNSPVSQQATLRGQSPIRLDGPARTISPSRVTSAWQSPTKIPMSAIPAKYEMGPARNSLGSGRGRSTRPMQLDALTLAVLRIQKFWRRRLAKRGVGVGHGSSNGQAPQKPQKPKFTAVHLAATRIQRKWRIQQWRRKFVDFSQRECGWVGSLEWLQHHNLLYGTELADGEDVRWWLQQRATAPLDREVDPWGSERLLEHLNRMWYGGRAAEVAEQQKQEQLLQQQQLIQQQHSRRSERDTLRERQRSREQRSEDIFMAFAVSPQDAAGQAVDNQAWSNGKVIMSSGRSQSGATTGVASSLRAVPSAERGSSVRQISLGHGKDTWRASTSLSPRRSLRGERDMNGVLEQRSEEFLTAFAAAVQEASGQSSSMPIATSGRGVASSLRAVPSSERPSGGRQISAGGKDSWRAFVSASQDASGQKSSKPIAMSGRMQGGGVASSLRAMPSSDRSSGGRQISVGGKESGRAAASLSPRQENGTPAACPGADSLAARLKGAVLGGAPPPAMHGYQRSYRVASHSPPQTHRAPRTTMPVTPNLVSSSMRPRSPVHTQSTSATTPSSSRLSLPSSASMQSRSLPQVQRHASSMNRALSGSPPPLVAGVGRSPVAGRR